MPSTRLNLWLLPLSCRGAWRQVLIAAILISVLPAMVLLWAWHLRLEGTVLSPTTLWIACGGVLLVIVLGYTMLFKYPASIVRLRHYLSVLADGGIPEVVTLSKEEDDLVAVQRYMECIVKMAEDRVGMLQRHHDVELKAERQRVMVESLGAICHHLGQPTTALAMSLYCLRNSPSPEKAAPILADCDTALAAIFETLSKLQTTAHYCSETYLTSSSGDAEEHPRADARIIKV